MFATLFQRPTVIARYRSGPLADERERFLKQCESRGYSRSMLQKIAWVLLAVAHCIPIDHGKVTARDIEQAVDGRWSGGRSTDPRKLAGLNTHPGGLQGVAYNLACDHSPANDESSNGRGRLLAWCFWWRWS